MSDVGFRILDRFGFGFFEYESLVSDFGFVTIRFGLVSDRCCPVLREKN